MKLTIYGAGYVGLVSAVCFADWGHTVCCVDIDAEKIQQLQQGENPLYEPGLTELLQKNLTNGRLTFSSDLQKAITNSNLHFLCVGTPSLPDGAADLTQVLSVATAIANNLQEDAIVVNKSTVPVGTAGKLAQHIQHILTQRKVTYQVDVASNPEFLREGCAIQDFIMPDRVVVGTENSHTASIFEQLYAPLLSQNIPLLFMQVKSAELTKYAANAMLASRISLMNDVARIANVVGGDIKQVEQGIGLDSRIGPAFLQAGCGYGGSCFPKDVRAIAYLAQQYKVQTPMLAATEASNDLAWQQLVATIQGHYKQDLNGRTFALWGLAFKPDTDDIREAPSLKIINRLQQLGAKIKAYDPQAMSAVKAKFANEAIDFCSSPEECLTAADGLIIITPWDCFLNISLQTIASSLQQAIIFDGRNCLDLAEIKKLNLIYYGVGR